MSLDKRKNTVDSGYIENDKQFLERSGASGQVRDVLSKILENRPDDPIAFLADFFDSLGDKIDRTAKAYQQICLTHYTKPAFANNINIAYEILGQTKGKHVKGINGMIYVELLHMLCKEFPPSVRDKLFRKIKCRDFEVVKFDVFRSAIFTCLVLKDFLRQSESLFLSLDAQKCGKVDRALCEAVTHQLHDAVAITSNTPSTVLEAGYMLGPRKLANNLTTAFFKAGSDKRQLNMEDFVVLAADAFLVKVRDFDINEDESWHSNYKYYVHSS